MVDAYGRVAEQVIGQSDISLTVQVAQLTDNDTATPAPQTILVNAKEGAAISSSTGEAVLIGAGALAQDTAVSINRIALNSIDPASSIFAAQPSANNPNGGLQAIGAFTLNIGTTTAAYPLQLSIPVQDSIAANVGDEVIFLRKGKVLVPTSTAGNLVYREILVVVDNGFIGLDANGNAVAKNRQPTYSGLRCLWSVYGG